VREIEKEKRICVVVEGNRDVLGFKNGEIEKVRE